MQPVDQITDFAQAERRARALRAQALQAGIVKFKQMVHALFHMRTANLHKAI